MNDELEARVTELELRSMAQQDLISQLNDALIAQQQQLDALLKAYEQLRKKTEAMPGLVDAAADEKPPHY